MEFCLDTKLWRGAICEFKCMQLVEIVVTALDLHIKDSILGNQQWVSLYKYACFVSIVTIYC